MKLKNVQFSKETTKALKELKFEKPTPIQEQSIPSVIAGKDVIGLAQTGTGKTAAFVLPIIEKIDVSNRNPQALIVCPTRELAIQVTKAVEEFSKYHNTINSITIYGGASIGKQIKGIKKGVHIVVGTPGRLQDLINRRVLKLNNIETVVLDEADEMLNMGFRQDIEKILKEIKNERQMLLFSATMSSKIKNITKKYQNRPEKFEIKRKEITAKNVEQGYLKIKTNKEKVDVISRLIEIEKPRLSLIFCNTKRKVDEVCLDLQDRGYICNRIHGDIAQNNRTRIMEKYRQGKFDVLVATDVMARGIDVDEVDLVINYGVPREQEKYVHRIGRTGRAGREGKAFTLINNSDSKKIKQLMRYIKQDIKRHDKPTIKEVKRIKSEKIIENLMENIEKHEKTQEYDIDISKFSKEQIFNFLIENEMKKSKEKKSKKQNSKLSSIETGAEVGMVRFFLNKGKRDRIRPKDIVGSISAKAKISSRDIGKIDILDSFSFFEISQDKSEEVLNVMNGNTMKGKTVVVEPANSK